MLMRHVDQIAVRTVLIIATMVTAAGCQPRAAVAPAPRTPQAAEQTDHALRTQAARDLEKQSSSIPLPPPPPPPPKSTADTTVSAKGLFSYIRRKPPEAAPAADATQSVAGTPVGAQTTPSASQPPGDQTSEFEQAATPSAPVPIPLGDAAPKIEGTETTATSVPLVPDPPPGAVPEVEDTATPSQPAPFVPDMANATTAIDSDYATTSDTAPLAREPRTVAKLVRQKPQWKNVRSANALPDQNTVYDENNPGFQTLQKANQALQGFPLLRKQGVLDWAVALNSGLIQPRASLADSGQMLVLDLDILMKDTKSTRHVRFSHKTHTQWLECSNCHQQIFKPKIGANPISMAAILDGKFCGVCHNTVAFPVSNCERCHSIPKDR